MAFLTYQLGKGQSSELSSSACVRGLRPDLNYAPARSSILYCETGSQTGAALEQVCAPRHDLCATSDPARQVCHLPKVNSPRHYGLAAVTSSSLSDCLQGLQNPWRFGFPPQGLGIVIFDQYISSQIPAHFVSENIRQQSRLLKAHRATVPASSKVTCLVCTGSSFPVAETNSANAVANVLPPWRSSTPR